MMKDIPNLSEVYCILIQEQVYLDIGSNDDDLLQENTQVETRNKPCTVIVLR